MTQRMVTVLDPKFKPYPEGIHGRREYPTMDHYYAVPAISTYGTFRVLDMLTDDEKNDLAEMTNRMERTVKKGIGKVRGKRA